MSRISAVFAHNAQNRPAAEQALVTLAGAIVSVTPAFLAPHVFCLAAPVAAATILGQFEVANGIKVAGMAMAAVGALGSGLALTIGAIRNHHRRHQTTVLSIDNRPWLKRMGPTFALSLCFGLSTSVLYNTLSETGIPSAATAEQMAIALIDSDGKTFSEKYELITNLLCGPTRR